jgi:hypothetical protein
VAPSLAAQIRSKPRRRTLPLQASSAAIDLFATTASFSIYQGFYTDIEVEKHRAYEFVS